MADTARPRAGEEHEALAPKAAERAATPARRAPGAALPAGARPRPVRMPPGALQRLGAAAGNRAVANLLRPAAPAPAGPAPAGNAVGLAGGAGAIAEPGVTIQRYAGLAKGGGGSYAPPAPPVAPDPKGDSRFAKVAAELKKAAKETKAHPPAKVEAKKAADAAKPPANDKEAQAKASQADKMAGAKKGGFDKAAFIAAVKQAIAAAAPQSLEDADKFADSGKAEGVKTQVMGKVAKGKEDSAKDVAEKTKEPPDTSKATEKPVKPLEEQKETKPQPPGFAKAMPAKVPGEQTNFEGPKNEVADKMAEADVSESDLKKSNEPQMVAAVEAKKEGEEHSAKAPGEIRAKEAEVLKEAEAGADQNGKGGLEAMVGTKKNALAQTGAKKDDQKSKDEAKRAEIAAELNKIYDRTKGDVEKILTDLDAKVDDAFTKGEAEVRLAFTNEHKGELQRFKDRRYAGAEGAIQWGIDLFKNLSEVPEVKRIYERAKSNYERGMERVISNVADLVGGEIDRAKERIAKGRQEIKDWVASKPKDIQKLADEAAKGMDEKFNQLESDVDNKSESLASDLAEKYTTALGEVNTEIEEAQAANRSAWSKAKAAVGESLDAIMKLKDLFMGLLAKAAGAFKKILADPVAFIGNFMSAVKAGFMGFVNKIAEYLKKGLQGWLFGKLGEAGIEVPDKLDLPGILKMVLSILGLTWAALRTRIVKRIGEKAMKVLEGASDIFIILVKEGVPGLWKWIVDKVGDLKEMVVGQIRNFVIEKIVKAGITWVIGMLNPAGALIKIVQTLISVIQWIMEKGGALVELVGTIVDSVSDIAHGGLGGVPAKIEGALAKAVPIVISFLASLLGLGGIGEKIKSILDTVRGPVGKAVDAVIAGALKVTKPIWAAIQKGGAWAKKKAKQAKDFVKKKYEQGKAWVKEKAGAAKAWVKSKFTRQEKPFSMKNTPHTLVASPTGSGFSIKMKSLEEPLSKKVRDAIEGLKERAATEQPDERARTEDQIRQLDFIAVTAARLEKEAVAKGEAVTGPTGAPPGFEEKMRRLAGIIEDYAKSSGETDIIRSASGTQVDLALLQRFGLPMASYLQAQKAADQNGSTIQIRATNASAPKLLEQGLLPKPESLKMKTIDEDDVLLGVPAEHKSKPAMFLPRTPERESFPDDVTFERALKRYKFRTQEYEDIMTVDKTFTGLIKEGQLAFVDKEAMGASSGGLIVDAARGLAFTGDHDLFHVTGNKHAVINALQSPPFRVQHGAHMDWPEAIHKMADAAKKAHMVKIFNNVVRKHIFGMGGEGLLQVNKDGPPTTAHAEIGSLLPEETGGGDGGPAPAATVVQAGPHGASGEKKAGDETVPSVTITEGFEANGEHHTVTATAGTNGVDVTVASTPKSLDDVKAELKSAKAAAEGLSPSSPAGGTDILKIIDDVSQSKEMMEMVVAAHKQAPPPDGVTDHEKRFKALADTMKSQLNPQVVRVRKLLSVAFRQLHQGKVRQLPAAVKVREHLYLGSGSGWGDARKAIYARDFPKIISDVARARKDAVDNDDFANRLEAIQNFGEPAIDKSIVAMAKTGTMDAGTLREAKWWQVDHRVPLAAHWQLEGNNSGDDERRAAATDPGKLQLIARDENLGAGSAFGDHRYGFAREVGPKFFSAYIPDDRFKVPLSS